MGSTVRFNAAALVAFDSGDESLACTEIWSCHGHQEGAFFCTAKMVVLVVVSRFFYFHPYLGKVIQFDESNFAHANLSWIPFVKDSPFGLNIFGTFW